MQILKTEMIKKRKVKNYEWLWYWKCALDDTKFRERNSALYRKLDCIFHTERFTKIK